MTHYLKIQCMCYYSNAGSIDKFISGSSVRLADGPRGSEGRVELWFGGAWQTVCDDFWGLSDANVICKNLRYPAASAALGSAYFGQGQFGPILDNVACSGSETSVYNCPHNGLFVENCGHSEDAGVRCEW